MLALATSKSIAKALRKEQRGIYNVTYNNKIATYIKTDLDSIDSAIRYARGDKSKGANHIKLRHHTDTEQEGYITQQELLNMGNNIREYLAKHKEPFIDEKGTRLYEWKNEAGERFRIVVDNIKASGSRTTPQLPRPPAEEIITFYSDRNAKNKMEFKNPALNQSKNAESKQNSTLESTNLINDKLPPMMKK